MDEHLTFLRFAPRDGATVAVFKYRPRYDSGYYGAEASFNLESLTYHVANRKAAGQDASITEKALREWPDPEGCPTNP